VNFLSRLPLVSSSECRRVTRLLQAYLDGELAPAPAETVRHHLDVCRRCGLEASTYEAIKVAIGAGAPDPQPVDADAVARLRAFAQRLGEGGGSGPDGRY
jgi:anti-sigma factor RsiW